MKNTQKIFLFLVAIIVTLIFVPTLCNAQSAPVTTESDLRTAVENAQNNDVIELGASIVLTRPLSVTGKILTIDGKGFTISCIDTNWTPESSNSTLITAGGDGTKLTLKNLTLKDAVKYGVQSYNGAYVILDGVNISNCRYGGVLANAGTVEIKDLNLGKNGQTSNNGIEIARGTELLDSDNVSGLVMNGKLTSTEPDNVIYLATNDNLKEFNVSNTETSEYQLFVSGDKVVVTDENNKVLFSSNSNSNVEVEGETFIPNVTVTVNIMDKQVPVEVKSGTILTKEALENRIDLASLDMSNYKIVGFYTTSEYTTEFDFTDPITTDTTVYAKTEDTTQPKDESPKTGVETPIGLALLVLTGATMGLVALKRKEV